MRDEGGARERRGRGEGEARGFDGPLPAKTDCDSIPRERLSPPLAHFQQRHWSLPGYEL
jgi:hypothetical protein